MGRISTGVGLITGTKIADTVDQLIAIAAQPRTRLEDKIKGLQAQQTAYTQLTTLVIGVQLAGKKFAADSSVYSSTKVTSSNTAVSVTKTGEPSAGDTLVRVLQLAQTHSASSRAFASSTAALGSTGTLEIRGQGFVDESAALETLNGGTGVSAGSIRITDRTGASAVIDLRAARTIDDVIRTINQSTGVRVSATVDGDRLKLTDTSGGAGPFRIDDVGAGKTAADLGFHSAAVVGNSLTGDDIVSLGSSTALADLVDGLGVGLDRNGADLQVTLRDGSSLSINVGDFGRVADNASGTTANVDTNARVTIEATATGGTDDGVEVVFLDDASVVAGSETVELLEGGSSRKLVFHIDAGNTTASQIASALAGSSLQSRFTATAGGTGAGTVSTSDTATLSGGSAITAPSKPTIGDLLRVLNDADPTKLRVQLSASGDGLEFVDLTGGGGSLTIANVGSSTIATDLGVAGTTAGSTLTGSKVTNGLRSVRLSSLAQVGSTPLGTLNITTRDGSSGSVDLSSATSLQDVINLIDQSGLDLKAEFNSQGTGIRIRDVSGGTSSQLTISSVDDTASRLKLSGSTSETVFNGGGLDRRFVARGTSLTKLNQGKGVSDGSLQITDSLGQTASFSLSQSTPKTVGDVIDTINSLGLAVNARVNSTGDGIELVDTGNGAITLSVTDSNNGTTAKDLGIAGSAQREIVDGSVKQRIDGSLVTRVRIDATDTLATLAEKVRNEGQIASVSVVTGAGGSRLQFSALRGGAQGRFAVESDGIDLGIRTNQVGQDAVIALGADGGLLRTSADGVFTDAIAGVSLTANEVTTAPATIRVSDDTDAIVSGVKSIVDQYNKLVDAMDKLDFFNADDQSTGLLFGSHEIRRIRDGFGRLFTDRLRFTGNVQTLQSLGVTMGENKKLTLSESKLRTQIESNRSEVKSLLSDGTRGLQKRIDKLADQIAGAENSALINRTTAINAQIETSTARVDFMSARLELERNRMLTQFYAVESAVSKMQSNQSFLSSITKLTV